MDKREQFIAEARKVHGINMTIPMKKITENHIRNIVKETLNERFEIWDLLSEGIREELSINNRVSELTGLLLNQINDKVKSKEKVKIVNGVFKQSFSLEPIEINGYNLIVNVTNFEFINRDTFNLLYSQYKSFIESSKTLPMLEKKKFYIYLHTCSISGGLRTNISSDNLQHEIEHCFQMSNVGYILPKDGNYTKAFSIINTENENTLTYKVALALYYSYPFEQDGFVNGLYQYIENSEQPVVEWFDIENTSAYEAFSNLNNIIKEIKSTNTNEISKILNDIFKMTYEHYISLIESGKDRFIHKIGKVLAKHRMDAIKNGCRINENLNNGIFSFI